MYEQKFHNIVYTNLQIVSGQIDLPSSGKQMSAGVKIVQLYHEVCLKWKCCNLLEFSIYLVEVRSVACHLLPPSGQNKELLPLWEICLPPNVGHLLFYLIRLSVLTAAHWNCIIRRGEKGKHVFTSSVWKNAGHLALNSQTAGFCFTTSLFLCLTSFKSSTLTCSRLSSVRVWWTIWFCILNNSAWVT